MAGGRKRPMPRWLDRTGVVLGLLLIGAGIVLRATRGSRDGVVLPAVVGVVAVIVVITAVLLGRRYGPPEP